MSNSGQATRSLLSDKTDNSLLTVSQLNREARFLLEGNFPAVLVEGELSNIAMPASGHWYFTLKDKNAQVRCAMFRNRNQRVRFKPSNGQQIQLKAKLSLYEGRGDYQLIVESMEECGDGALRQAYEELKQQLFTEGLFAEAEKKPLPSLPRHIGVITSPTGAAIQDILSVLARRFPAIAVTIFPVTVQGQGAAGEMIKAIQQANSLKHKLPDLDVLIIGRGGGSLEDLWSFNDEQLARTIFNSELPIVSAVGHEVDFSIADFVADLRAATPSAAAEVLSPDQNEYQQLFYAYQQQYVALMRDKIAQHNQQLHWLSKQLRHPGRRLQEQAEKLKALEARLVRASQNQLYRINTRIKHLQHRLQACSPQHSLQHHQQRNNNLHARMTKAIRHVLLSSRQHLAAQSHALNTVSPLSTLSRGYSISYSGQAQVLTKHTQVVPGDSIRTRLNQGEIISTVTKTSID